MPFRNSFDVALKAVQNRRNDDMAKRLFPDPAFTIKESERARERESERECDKIAHTLGWMWMCVRVYPAQDNKGSFQIASQHPHTVRRHNSWRHKAGV